MDERRKIKYLEQLAFIKNVKPCYNPVLLFLLEKAEETAGGLTFTVNKKYKQDIAIAGQLLGTGGSNIQPSGNDLVYDHENDGYQKEYAQIDDPVFHFGKKASDFFHKLLLRQITWSTPRSEPWRPRS